MYKIILLATHLYLSQQL